MRIRTLGPLAAVAFLGAANLMAQGYALPSGSISIKFPDDSPVLFSGSLTDQSRATARGAAMVIDLRVSMVLRNVSAKQIHVGVEEQEVE